MGAVSLPSGRAGRKTVSAPVNPILVIQNNLPEYREELIHERAELQARLNKIDDEVATLDRLEKALTVVNV